LGNVGQVNYGSAKFAVVAMARIIAMENQSKASPPTSSRLGRHADDRSVPTRRTATAAAREERLRRSRADAIAPLCVYLASEGAATSPARCSTSAPPAFALRPYAPGSDGAPQWRWTPELIAEVAMPSLANASPRSTPATPTRPADE